MRHFWVLLLLVSAVTTAQARRPPDPTRLPTISLLTFAPGEIYWQRFGHNALLVREPSGQATVYNYGMFDFQQKNFFLNFARGRMLYRLDTDSLWRTLEVYRRENRWVVEQRLNLLPTQARELAEFLAWNALPENADYRYDYFVDNCSTRVRDVINHALGGELRRQLETQVTPVNYRHEGVRMMSPIVPLALALDLVHGPAAEPHLNVWQRSFLPEVLMQAMRSVQTVAPDGSRRPLVYAELTLQSGSGPEAPAQPLSFFWALLGAGVAIGVVLLGLSRVRSHKTARIVFSALSFVMVLVSGLGGLILLAIWMLTDHWAWHANHNLLLLNPLCLLLLPACIKSAGAVAKISRASVYLATAIALGALIVALAPGQSQAAWVALLLPVHWAIAYSFFRLTRLRPV